MSKTPFSSVMFHDAGGFSVKEYHFYCRHWDNDLNEMVSRGLDVSRMRYLVSHMSCRKNSTIER